MPMHRGLAMVLILVLAAAAAAGAEEETLSVEAQGAVLAHGRLHLRITVPHPAIGDKTDVTVWVGRELVAELSLPGGALIGGSAHSFCSRGGCPNDQR